MTLRPYAWMIAAMVTVCACATAPAQGPTPPEWVPNLLTEEEHMQGFFPLFDGETLDGWWVRGDNPDAFVVRDGNLVTVGPDGGWIFTDMEFDNFILRYEYRIVPLEDSIGNSGVAIRATAEGNPAFSGMEIQVLQPGWETDWQSSGAIYATVGPAVEADNPVGEWNTVEVLADGPRIRTIMNGQELYDILMTDFTPESTADVEWQEPLSNRAMRGHIALQDYNNSEVEFRKIRLLPLPGGEDWVPLFNGVDLTGWEVLRDPVWDVVTEDGETFIRGDSRENWNEGRCALRTVDEFQDFEIRLMFRLSEGANSGLFFRGQLDDPWPRSYEAQMDNSAETHWTGAIWAQTPATELRAFDLRWNHMVVRAVDRDIEVWVNGRRVVEYVAPEDRHEIYPYGWFSLQSHHEGMVADFKDIEIKVIE